MTFQPVIEKGDRYSSSWSIAERSSQPKPYLKPLPYRSFGGVWETTADLNSSPDIRNAMPLANGFYWDGAGSVTSASNKALEKLYGKLEQSEALLVAWKERQGALDLIASNVRRLVEIARAVKRRDPKVVRRVLKRNPKAKEIVRQPASLWLEYHFAIVPTILDIHHACGVLGYEFPVEKLTESSMKKSSLKSGGSEYSWLIDYQFDSIVKLGGEIYGLNPDLVLAAQLGFGQPLSVAWEMTPFSWFIDYFANVGQLVKNLEPRFPGVLTRNEYTTTLIRSVGSRGYRNREPLSQVPYDAYNSFYMSRVKGWPKFQLEFNSPLDLKGQQCSYIVAVLAGLLTSMKPKTS